MNDWEVKLELKKLKLSAEILQLQADALMVGRSVRIQSEYNGQPYGRSKRTLRGETRIVERVNIHTYGGFSLFLQGERLAISANEVEWL
jgi:hypothetical protein